MPDKIVIKGAREHNLKNIDVEIPRDKMTVITGLSGSGKSTLAFDTIYAEGQRRYVESLSSYARQFLGLMDKPDVDYIEGLSPAISIEQKTTSKNPRSTVGTVTEIYDYLRLLFARIGVPHCPHCGKEIKSQTIDQIVDQLLTYKEGSKFQLFAPIIKGKKGEHQKVIESARTSGYVRARIDGSIYELTEEITMDKNKKHDIDILIDRIIVKEGIGKRLTESIELAMSLNEGNILVEIDGKEEVKFSKNFACPDCGINIEEIEPRLFSFNSPFGACPNCTGLGQMMKIDQELLVGNDELSIAQGAIRAPGFSNIVEPNSFSRLLLTTLSKYFGFSLDIPFKKIPKKIKDAIFFGTEGENIPFKYNFGTKNNRKDFVGIIEIIEKRYKETASDFMKLEYEKYMREVHCEECHGRRLKKEALSVLVGGKNIVEVCDLDIESIRAFFTDLKLNKRDKMIADRIIKEINERLTFLINVGLSYLTLSRASGTLSGGESQRIRLATQIGSGLMGVIYILDEPSIGLHQRDNRKLVQSLKRLRDLGNTLIVVEHDEETMMEADHIIDIGPGAGEHGGDIVFQGPVKKLLASDSITGQYLSGRMKIEVPHKRRAAKKEKLSIIGATHNNLKNITVELPLGIFICITGVSGSGKSTLVHEILYKTLAKELYGSKDKPGAHKEIKGMENIDKVINIDQSPIGRTPRSNPATYTGVFDVIRDIFTMTQEAKMRGYEKGRFSFNVRGGRCEACSGDGMIKIEMHFLPDIYVPCEVCHGKRYNRETLEVKYKGKSIADVLNMTVEEALSFFENIPQIRNKLQTLHDVGLSYIRLGQPSTTLSGGEAQRIKLSTELSKRATGKTLYILDEPTTGLHFEDTRKLIEILQRLTDSGNTVLVIEHNLDVIKVCDHIIDIGPEGGNKGGMVVATGTPEEVTKMEHSYTGEYLKKVLE